jgi:hypothetical protein
VLVVTALTTTAMASLVPASSRSTCSTRIRAHSGVVVSMTRMTGQFAMRCGLIVIVTTTEQGQAANPLRRINPQGNPARGSWIVAQTNLRPPPQTQRCCLFGTQRSGIWEHSTRPALLTSRVLTHWWTGTSTTNPGPFNVNVATVQHQLPDRSIAYERLTFSRSW